MRLVQQSGWYEGSFVLPTGTIGNKVGEEVVFDGNADAVRYATAGSLQNWKDNVARPCAGNTRPVLARSIAFAGPLNDFLQGEGGGFHFVGPSSVGKSTMLLVGGSMWGGGGRIGFGYTWRGTENGLESIARAHSGTTLVLDEMGEADGQQSAARLHAHERRRQGAQHPRRRTERSADLAHHADVLGRTRPRGQDPRGRYEPAHRRSSCASSTSRLTPVAGWVCSRTPKVWNRRRSRRP